MRRSWASWVGFLRSIPSFVQEASLSPSTSGLPPPGSLPSPRATHPAPAWGAALYGDWHCRLLVASIGWGCLLLGLLVTWTTGSSGAQKLPCQTQFFPEPLPFLHKACIMYFHPSQPCSHHCSKACGCVCTFAAAAYPTAGAALPGHN